MSCVPWALGWSALGAHCSPRVSVLCQWWGHTKEFVCIRIKEEACSALGTLSAALIERGIACLLVKPWLLFALWWMWQVKTTIWFRNLTYNYAFQFLTSLNYRSNGQLGKYYLQFIGILLSSQSTKFDCGFLFRMKQIWFKTFFWLQLWSRTLNAQNLVDPVSLMK